MAAGEGDTFGERLRRARGRLGLTQGQLAARASISRAWLSALENDRSPRTGLPPIPRHDLVHSLARLLNEDANELLLLVHDTVHRAKGKPIRVAESGAHYGQTADFLSNNQVAQINAAYRYARFKRGVTGGGYDLEIRPPADDYDREGIMDRLAFIRRVEEDHGLRILGPDIE